jgi:hypothetical protein
MNAKTEFNPDVNMDALLDGTLDDLADAPSFEPFHPGAHKVTIEIEGPIVVNKHPAFKLAMKLVETVELEDKSLTPQVPGSAAEVLYMMDNELGQGNFKKLLGALNATFQAANNRGIIEAAKGTECLVITKVRPNKDKSAFYTEVKEISVV